MEPESSLSSPSHNVQRLWAWAKSHKLKAFFVLLGVYLLYEILTIPWFGVADLRTENPGETAIMRQRIREANGNDKQLTIKQRWIPLRKIPRYVINAIVVAEDGMFWEHGGFDWYEFQQSMKKNWEKKRAVRGASTITQQLAKNLYLSTSKSPMRKAKEWIITALLERNLDKNRILEIYLNVIEWGPGIFGIEAAAQKYFGHSAGSLSYEEALRLAAVIPSPLKHKPTDGSRWVSFRKNVVAMRMLGRGFDIDLEEPEEEEIEQPQIKEIEPSPLPTEPRPIDTGEVPIDDSTRRDTMLNDSTNIERDDSNDVQRREQTD